MRGARPPSTTGCLLALRLLTEQPRATSRRGALNFPRSLDHRRRDVTLRGVVTAGQLVAGRSPKHRLRTRGR